MLIAARALRLAIALAATVAALAFVAAPARAATDYETGYALGSKAYEYGIPIVDTDRIFRTNTSVSKPDHAGDAPVNQFSHADALAKPENRDVVAPNHDTLTRSRGSTSRASRRSCTCRTCTGSTSSSWSRRGPRTSATSARSPVSRRVVTSRSSARDSAASCHRA